ncbi:MAG: type IV pilus twitching motility protein PilT, partial [Candidatus Methylacidiphilales bacterium]
MDITAYNDYVLDASLQAGWIDSDQQQTARAALSHLSGVSALEFLLEQEMLKRTQYEQLKALIMESIEAGEISDAGNEQPAAKASSVIQTGRTLPSEHLQTVEAYLRYAMESGASDLHLGPDSPPLIRYNGALGAISAEASALVPEETEALARQFLNSEQLKMMDEVGSVDFCYEKVGLGRFRTSVVRQRRGWESVFRVISTRVRTMQELGFPQVMYDLIKYHNGLILVTGSVGSGKTTTLAAMVDQINRERKDHIITLEDPIEYVFEPVGCQITQREIHSHTESFATALRGSLRQDPDVIMVGEMRDLETISLAITASETGHLVLGTLHTSNAARTM